LAKRGKACPGWSFGKLQTKLRRWRVAGALRMGAAGSDPGDRGSTASRRAIPDRSVSRSYSRPSGFRREGASAPFGMSRAGFPSVESDPHPIGYVPRISIASRARAWSPR
jgi:hypothetical protein